MPTYDRKSLVGVMCKNNTHVGIVDIDDTYKKNNILYYIIKNNNIPNITPITRETVRYMGCTVQWTLVL